MVIKNDEDLNMIKNLERSVRDLARQRAMCIKVNVMTEDEVTEFINEKGAKYAAKYEPLDPFEMLLDLIADVAKDGADRREYKDKWERGRE